MTESTLRNDSRAPLDAAKAEAFAGTMLSAFNSAALCLMASVEHRTGLFDVMSTMPPSTPADIAARAGLNERYVREWLAAMTAARVLDYGPETGRFSLPAEHAAFLTRAAGADNIAVMSQYVALLGGVEDDIVDCFRRGGGVPYSRFHRLHEVMAEDSNQSIAGALESHILPLVPGLSDRLAAGMRVLDAGCGRGGVLRRLASLFPASRFVGMDLSPDAIACARDEAASQRLNNVTFVEADLSDFHETAEPDAFDVVTTFDAIHDQARPLNVLRGIHRTLTSGGVYLMQDINGTSHLHKDLEHPLAALLYTISCMHCMTVSLAQGGDGLGTMWGEEKTREYLRQAGFRSITTHKLAHDIINNWYVVTK